MSNWNTGAARIKGYTAEEIIGHHFSCFYTAPDREAGVPRRALETAAREGKFETEGWRVRKDGKIFWASTVIDPVRDESGALLGFAKITRDLTDYRRTHDEMECLADELRQAQKMEALGQLTGGIAHDFNNILTAIVSNIELARSRPQNGDRDAPLVSALDAAQSGAALVRRMLVFARNQHVHAEPVDIDAAIAAVLAIARPSCPPSIAIRTAVASDLPNVSCDPNQLQGALINVLVNARDAMPDGGVLTVSAAMVHRDDTAPGALAPGDYVAVSVTDTGLGMTPDVAARAFDPFFTTKDFGQASGLGLSMVYAAARQFGGEARVESSVGAGTTVHIMLPVWRGEPASAASPTLDTAAPTAPLPSTDILYVEDEALVRTATAELLADAGFQVHAAASGEKALVELSRHPEITLIVTDIGLPGISGHEVVARARDIDPRLKAIFVTGYDRTGTIGDASDDADNVFLDKPYDTRKLLRVIRTMLAGAPT